MICVNKNTNCSARFLLFLLTLSLKGAFYDEIDTI